MKPDWKTLWKRRKKLILAVAAGIAAAGIGCGVWYAAGHSSKEPVYVFPFQYIGMTEYWGDSRESYGPVTTDKIQTVFLSSTQEVTEILVKEGDTVKKGDLLMTFDTTLSDLQLERKRLAVEKLKLQLEDARDDLREINAMKPMVIPEISDDEPSGSVDLGRAIRGDYELSNNKAYDGSSADKALICWIKGEKMVDGSLLSELHIRAAELQAMNVPDTPGDGEDGDGGDDGDDGSGAPPPEEIPIEEEPVLESSSASASARSGGDTFYVVFKVTAGNMSLGDKKVWQCLAVTENGGSYAFRFADTLIPDYTLNVQTSDEPELPEIDYGSGYTAAQIAQMRSEKQKAIQDLEFQIKMADAEYKIMLTEVSDGNVYADIDGQVVSLLTQEEAKQTAQPVLKLSGGGGFYVEGTVSELEKDSLKIGQEVTVNDWNSGMSYTGTIESMGDFPNSQNYYGGMGNPNASYYPFRVFVDGEADLQAGSYVSIMYSSAESQNGIYLENPFLRTEQGKSYVLVLGAEGKLERRDVVTGKSLWGNYTEILSGLTAEDLVAFPYGKNVKPGVPAQEGDISELYR